MSPKLDELGFKILFLLIPGIIALGVMKSIGPKRPRSDLETGIQIFIYGVVCYAIAGFFEGLYGWYYLPATKTVTVKGFWQTVGESSLALATLNPEKGLGTAQIVAATVVAVIFGCCVANLQRHSIPHRLLRTLRLTNRTNEFDIWDLTLNSPTIDSWVTVRHHDNQKVYQGWVRAYSDGGDERELLLGDVAVYALSTGSNDLVQVDTVPVMYLGLERKNTVLEFRTS
jgi:hypothetical protein